MDKKQTLSFSIICKNEEAVIALALDSIKEVADEIVILDTGSTDKTKEIAKKYTDKVYDWVCPGDWSFAKARNEAKKYCTCDWVCIIDCDEVLDENSKGPIKKMINEVSENIDEILCKVTVPDAQRPNIPALNHLCHRLHRNKESIMWAGEGHNFLKTDSSRRVVCYSINFIHNRKNKPKERNEERNIQRFEHLTKVLKEGIKENPNNPRNYFYIANTYRDYKHYKEAVTYYKAYLKRTRWVEEKYQAIIYLAQCLLQLDKIDEAFNILLLALEVDSGRCEAEYLLGQIAEGRKLYNQAKFWYEAAIKPIPNRALFIEGRYYTYGPVDKLSLVYWKLGKKEGALKYVKKALEYVPTDKRFQKNVEVIEKSLKGGKNVILK